MLASIARERIQQRKAALSRHPKAAQWSTDRVLTEYRDDPVGFIRDVLGVELYDRQIEIARAVATRRRVGVKSGQKTGKTKLCICIAIWWACSRAKGCVIMTSASFEQVKDPLWKEMHDMHRNLVARGLEKLIPAPALDPGTGCRWDDGRYIRGVSTNKRERAAGKSGAEQLFILDEASGIATEIAEAFLGNTLGGGNIMMTSNPTETSGFFYDAFAAQRGFWEPFTISARDTPNYKAGEIVIPGLATREDVDAMVATYGEDSPQVAVRVHGEFPLNLSDAVIGIGLIDMANRAWATVSHDGARLEMGVDVALYGEDDSVITARRGLALYTPRWIEAETGERAVVNGQDPTQVALQTIVVMRALRREGELVRIKVDSTGGFGAGVAAKIREMDLRGVEVVEVNVSETPDDPIQNHRRRDEIWFNGRLWIQMGGAFPPDPELEKELIAPKYSITPKGAKRVEPKDETKKRLKRSPDRADSALLAIYEPKGFQSPDWDFLSDVQSAWPKALDI